MTPLRSKLEEILKDKDDMWAEDVQNKTITQIIQAITELIEEAQPEKSEKTYDEHYCSAYQDGIKDYKSNLLKGVRG